MPIRPASLVVLLAAVAAPLAAQTAHTDFSGTWVLDATRTIFDGQIPVPQSATYVVVQVGDSIAVDQRIVTEVGELVQKKVWKVDGKPWANTTTYAGAALPLSSTLAWRDAVLAIRTTADFQGNAVDQAETWTLSGDGKMLTLATTTNVNGDYFASATLVFNKK